MHEIPWKVSQVPTHQERYHDDNGVDDSDHARLGRGEQPTEYAPDDDERYQQRQHAPPGRARHLTERRTRPHILGEPEEIAVHHQPQANHYAWHDTADEERGDRDPAYGTVDDGHDARRDHVGYRRRRCHERGRVRRVVPLPFHGRQHHPAYGRNVRR